MTPTVATPTPPTAPPPPRRKRGRSVVLRDVSWDTYRKLLRAFGEKPGVRLTYDNEVLEIMVPSFDHDRTDRILSQFVHILAEELGLPLLPGGQATLKRRRKLKGIEADDIFWIAHAARLAGVKELDLKIHPPPDLALEVDVWNSSLNRLRIHAALGIPEVWRWEGDTLTFHVLTGKRYTAADRSRSFPLVAPADVVPFVTQARAAGDQIPIYRTFREWVRQRAASLTPS